MRGARWTDELTEGVPPVDEKREDGDDVAVRNRNSTGDIHFL